MYLSQTPTPECYVDRLSGHVYDEHEDPDTPEESESPRPTEHLHYRVDPEIRVVRYPQDPEK